MTASQDASEWGLAHRALGTIMSRRLQALLAILLAVGCRDPGAGLAASGPILHVTIATEWAGRREAQAAESLPATSHPGFTWVLHVGDSFVDASFQQNLRPRFRTAGADYVSNGGTATYTTTWAQDPQLDRWLSSRPALVIVTLGANEVDLSVPDAHAKAIERITHKIAASGASCVWTAPPLWKRDTGILKVIHDHCAPCLFFDSDAVLGGLVAAERQADRIHPNSRGGARWAEAFWMWLVDHRDLAHGPWALVPFERRGA
jgi:lysophospholipase L1-like esterase